MYEIWVTITNLKVFFCHQCPSDFSTLTFTHYTSARYHHFNERKMFHILMFISLYLYIQVYIHNMYFVYEKIITRQKRYYYRAPLFLFFQRSTLFNFSLTYIYTDQAPLTPKAIFCIRLYKISDGFNITFPFPLLYDHRENVICFIHILLYIMFSSLYTRYFILHNYVYIQDAVFVI